MTVTSLAAGTGVGAVHIAVTDGERALRFYEDVLGLRRLGAGAATGGGAIRLGAGDRELVVLHPGASAAVAPNHSGLYHLALVVPSRRDLAIVIARVAAHGHPQSPTDHVLTKADYLWDPDGNGIEVYTETPEDGTWYFDEIEGFAARDAQGRPHSGREAIDLDDLFSHVRPEDRTDAPLPPGTRMGHVHLHVSHLRDAVDFYSGLVGFDVQGTSQRLGMAFVSAGGYHHHVGLNTWAGEGAPPAPPGTSGLRSLTVEVPGPADLEGVAERLSGAGLDVLGQAPAFEARDPSGNLVRFRVR